MGFPDGTRLLCPWGFSRREYWGGHLIPSLGDLPDPGIELRSPALQVDSLSAELPGKQTPVVKNSPANKGVMRYRFDLWLRRFPWRRAWLPTLAFWPGESPWTEKPDGLQSIRPQRVRDN